MIEQRHPQSGMTLIEVLVSLAIFAVIGVAGMTVLNTVVRTGDRTEGRLERLAEIDRAFLVIRRDLAQVDSSSTRLSENGLEFKRNGDSGSLTISYMLDDSILIRQVRLDARDPVDQEVLSGVAAMEWRLMTVQRQWTDAWPMELNENLGLKAAELMLDVWREDRASPERVTRLFPYPAGHNR